MSNFSFLSAYMLVQIHVHELANLFSSSHQNGIMGTINTGRGRIHKATFFYLSENFKCMFLDLFSIILQCFSMFFISMQSFIEVLRVKIEQYAFEIFTLISKKFS